MSLLQSPASRRLRRAWPIHAYVGANGSGKSAGAVWDTLPTLEQGRPVLSTVRLLDYGDPRPCPGCDLPGCERGHAAAHPLWVPFRDWTQLLDAEHCDVIMDEVTGVASSRESQSMPSVVANFLVQLRRRDVVLRWTAPNWARADKIIRECTQAVTYCRGLMPTTAVDDDGDRMWRHRRLFRWKTYDAADFDEFTEGKRTDVKPHVSDWHWGPGSPAFAAYDTLDAVMSIGTVTDGGRCVACGGRRRVAECSCPDYHKPEPKRRHVAAHDASGGGVEVPSPPSEVPTVQLAPEPAPVVVDWEQLIRG